MTTLAWILAASTVVLFLVTVVLIFHAVDLRKSINSLRFKLELTAESYRNERDDRLHFERAYHDLQDEIEASKTTKEDLDYVRDSILRAADDDPMT